MANPAAGDTVTIEGLKLASVSGQHAVASASTGTVKYVDCTFGGAGYGIYVSESASSTVIDGCTFNSLSFAIGGIQNWAQVDITNNTFVSCAEAVGYVSSGASGINVLNELVADGNTGVYESNVKGY